MLSHIHVIAFWQDKKNKKVNAYIHGIRYMLV